jgi:two-component system invasion response regulator UvrY
MVIKVLIADDHPIVREGLKRIFAKEPHMDVVAEARNGREVLDKIESEECDVILLDINMPGPSWLEVLKELKSRKPRLPIIILSMHKEEEYIVRALKSGASGYLTKESVMDELVQAVRKVAQGGKYVSPLVAEKLVDYLDVDADTPLHRSLSDREYEVMGLLASGKKTREIANDLFLSPNTVSTYRARILDKMRMKNVAELVQYAVKNNLLD